MRKALIKDTEIVNIIEADGTYTPPVGHSVVDAQTGWAIGGFWDGTVYTPSPEQAEEIRRRGLSQGDRVDEDIIAPFLNVIRSPTGHIIRAVLETLLDGINIERVDRGASAISMSQATDSIRAKLILTYKDN